MDDREVSARATQWLLGQLSDNPRQFAEQPFAALTAQCRRARDAHSDGLNYLSVPF